MVEKMTDSRWISGIFPFGIRSKKGNTVFDRFSNGLGHNRSQVSGSWAEIEGVHTNFSISSFSFVSKIVRVAG